MKMQGNHWARKAHLGVSEKQTPEYNNGLGFRGLGLRFKFGDSLTMGPWLWEIY